MDTQERRGRGWEEGAHVVLVKSYLVASGRNLRLIHTSTRFKHTVGGNTRSALVHSLSETTCSSSKGSNRPVPEDMEEQTSYCACAKVRKTRHVRTPVSQAVSWGRRLSVALLFPFAAYPKKTTLTHFMCCWWHILSIREAAVAVTVLLPHGTLLKVFQLLVDRYEKKIKKRKPCYWCSSLKDSSWRTVQQSRELTMSRLNTHQVKWTL